MFRVLHQSTEHHPEIAIPTFTEHSISPIQTQLEFSIQDCSASIQEALKLIKVYDHADISIPGARGSKSGVDDWSILNHSVSC